MRGSDLNRRPLGYESPRGLAGNPLISRRMSRTTSNYWFLSDSPAYLSFEDVSGWYGSKTGADDLWVVPKPVPVPFTARHQPRRWRPVAGGNGIRTRVCCSPRAFLVRSVSCVVLTQHLSPWDSNSAGILVPGRLPPTLRGRLSLTTRDSGETYRGNLGL